MKVAIFRGTFPDSVESAINNFIRFVKVIDIKISPQNNYIVAMIMYEEERE